MLVEIVYVYIDLLFDSNTSIAVNLIYINLQLYQLIYINSYHFLYYFIFLSRPINEISNNQQR